MLHRHSDTQRIRLIQESQGYPRRDMASPSASTKINLTYEQVSKWREDLFEGRTLRVSVEELRKWPLNHYLWAAVLQATRLDEMREQTEQHWQTPAWDFGRFA